MSPASCPKLDGSSWRKFQYLNQLNYALNKVASRRTPTVVHDIEFRSELHFLV